MVLQITLVLDAKRLAKIKVVLQDLSLYSTTAIDWFIALNLSHLGLENNDRSQRTSIH
jgi:hypothetical protein